MLLLFDMNKTAVRGFKKYSTRGAYHWMQISNHPKKRNAFVIARYKNCINLISKYSTKGPEKIKVLDAGCGDGALSYFIAKKGFNVSGVDLSHEAIESGDRITKSKGLSINFKQGSVYEIPFKENTFDVVVSSEVIEHLEQVDLFLEELRRVVIPGGIIIITTPIRLTKYPVDPEHVIEWFKEDFEDLLKKHFKKVSFLTSHPVVWADLYQARYSGQMVVRLFMNIISYVYNPFLGFNKRYRSNSVQYAVCVEEKNQ